MPFVHLIRRIARGWQRKKSAFLTAWNFFDYPANKFCGGTENRIDRGSSRKGLFPSENVAVPKNSFDIRTFLLNTTIFFPFKLAIRTTDKFWDEECYSSWVKKHTCRLEVLRMFLIQDLLFRRWLSLFLIESVYFRIWKVKRTCRRNMKECISFSLRAC